MPKKMKLNLENLKVKSFLTSITLEAKDKAKIKGGFVTQGGGLCEDTMFYSCFVSDCYTCYTCDTCDSCDTCYTCENC
jgi:hypothetical protein